MQFDRKRLESRSEEIPNLKEMLENGDHVTIGGYDLEMVPSVVKVIENYPAVIVFFSNGDKSVSKVREDDEFSVEMGAAVAIAKYYTDLGWGDFQKMIQSKVQ